MKRLLILFGLILFMTACDDSIKKVDNPKKITTVEILEHLPQDTVVIAKSEDVFYILNEDNLVEYKLVGQNGHDSVMLFLMIWWFCIGVLVGFLIFDE